MTHADPHPPRTVVPVASTPLINVAFNHAEVTDLRHTVASCARASGLAGQRLDDFVLAVNELITNAVRHGGGAGWLRFWAEDHTVMCEVSDAGGGIAQEQLGTQGRPAPHVAGGWGLWLAEQLSDHMVLKTGPAGTTVRISSAARRGVSPAPVE